MLATNQCRGVGIGAEPGACRPASGSSSPAVMNRQPQTLEPVTRLRRRATLHAVRAPELDRYLDRRNIDLVITDEVQALQVRFRRALEVFEHRVESALATTARALRHRLLLILVAALVTAISAAGVEWSSRLQPVLLGVSALTIALLAGDMWFIHQDQRQLRHAARVLEQFDPSSCETAAKALALADEILGLARALGAVEPRTSDSSDADA